MKLTTLFALLLSSTALWSYASDDDHWSVHVGTSYRNFDDINIRASAFRNSNSSNAVGGPFGIQNLQAAQPNLPAGATQVTVDVVSFTGDSDSADSSDQWSPVIGLERRIHDNDDFELRLALNFQFFDLDISDSSTSAGNFASSQQTYAVLGNTIVAPAINTVPGVQAGTTVALGYDVDAQFFVVDLGLKARSQQGRFSLAAAVGPTLTFSDLDTQHAQRETHTIIPNTLEVGGAAPSNSSTTRLSDDESEFLFGVYAGVEVGVSLSDTLALHVGYRYDWVFDDAATDLVSIDLDTHSLFVKLALQL